MSVYKGRRGRKTNRSQLVALLTSTCVAFSTQTIMMNAASGQTKSTVEFSIKDANPPSPPVNSALQEEPIRISLPSALPSPRPVAVAPSAPAHGLPLIQGNGSSTTYLPSAGPEATPSRVQMRLSSEEPPKLPVSATRSSQEVVRLNIPQTNAGKPVSAPQAFKKGIPVLNASGPVKFSVGDTGVKDFGNQGASIAPPSLARAPELVKPKKYSVSQTVVLARNSDLRDGANSIDRQEIVRQSLSDSQPESVQETDSMPQSIPSGMVSLTKPSKSKRSLEMNHIGLVSNRVSEGAEKSIPSNLRNAEVEREYDIEILGTYSIDAPFVISHVETLDPDCCSVFNNGRAITVVGKNEGKTKVAIISKDQQRRVVGVNVLPSGQQPATPKSDLEQVKEMISKLFPDANLSFSNQDFGAIEVRGTTKSEVEARKVLELVRRICLVPVEDKVKVVP